MFVARCSVLAAIVLLGVAVASPSKTAPQTKNEDLKAKEHSACSHAQAGPLWKSETYKKQTIYKIVPEGENKFEFSVDNDICAKHPVVGVYHVATVVSACDPDGYPPAVVLDDIEGGTVYRTGLNNSPIEVAISVYCRPSIP